jgi:hypothetical protein
MTFASPFIAGSRRGPASSRKRPGSETACLAAIFLEQLRSAFAAPAASGSDTELEGEFVHAFDALARAFADLSLGDGVTDADIHATLTL